MKQYNVRSFVVSVLSVLVLTPTSAWAQVSSNSNTACATAKRQTREAQVLELDCKYHQDRVQRYGTQLAQIDSDLASAPTSLLQSAYRSERRTLQSKQRTAQSFANSTCGSLASRLAAAQTSAAKCSAVPPAPVITFEVQDLGTGRSAKNGETLFAPANSLLQYKWTASGAANAAAHYRIVSGPNSCGWAQTGNWPSAASYYFGASGSFTAGLQGCQAGSTFEIVYRPVNSTGSVIGEQRLYVVVY